MKVIEEYFDAFVNKDLARLSELYSDDVVLSEWDENVFTGKEAVLQANADLFSKFKKIGILVRARGESGTISLNEIIVNLDDVSVKVVDSIAVHNEKIVYIINDNKIITISELKEPALSFYKKAVVDISRLEKNKPSRIKKRQNQKYISI